ncbi:MAG: rod shape-determining protein MreC [Desulfobacteraceae bacterium]|nr:rod shape-determining protein MreC [Desulfobacteraceae bacterium]
MFSRKMVLLIGIVFFILVNFIVLTVSSKDALPKSGVERITISLIAPFQMAFSRSFTAVEGVWDDYFAMVSASKEYPRLRKEAARAVEIANRCKELELENSRLRKFIRFQDLEKEVLVAAKVIARDPSPWFKTIMIDKGALDGLTKGLPVLVSEGVVGQVITVARRYSRVLLVTDRNSAVDALVQTSRARGIVKGTESEFCSFRYVLRKNKIEPGEMIISSGLDGVFPKGLRVGRVVDVKEDSSQLFQAITVKTCVDFDKLEEVLVSLKDTGSESDDL